MIAGKKSLVFCFKMPIPNSQRYPVDAYGGCIGLLVAGL
jgi:hypothetical protein